MEEFPGLFIFVARVEHDTTHQIQTLSTVISRIAGVAAATSIEAR